ncbi:CAAX prenyl protease [Balamuthia mandrillaris]
MEEEQQQEALQPLFQVNAFGAVFSCALLTVWFVGSLYLWPKARTLNRDDPVQIKRRFMSVGLVCATSVVYLWFWAASQDLFSVLYWMGVHGEALIQAATLPLLLTMILFLGPLVMLYYDNPWGSAKGFTLWLSKNFTELSFWRNYIVGPFTEEWVFRSCMCPLLICGGFHWSTTIFLSPFFFGVAHLHHIIQHLHKTGEDLHNAWMEVLFQLFYTTVFGCYSAFLFLRTGHIIAPFLAHAFCNFMGFPQVDEIPDHPHKRKKAECPCYSLSTPHLRDYQRYLLVALWLLEGKVTARDIFDDRIVSHFSWYNGCRPAESIRGADFSNYTSLQDFFLREIKPRPIEPEARVVAPFDGIVINASLLNESNGFMGRQVKGIDYPLEEVLALNNEEKEPESHGEHAKESQTDRKQRPQQSKRRTWKGMEEAKRRSIQITRRKLSRRREDAKQNKRESDILHSCVLLLPLSECHRLRAPADLVVLKRKHTLNTDKASESKALLLRFIQSTPIKNGEEAGRFECGSGCVLVCETADPNFKFRVPPKQFLYYGSALD